MHRCEQFRERISELIIDRVDLTGDPELRACPDCTEFYAQSLQAMEALDQIDQSISRAQWEGIERRLCSAVRTAADSRLNLPARRRFQWTPFLAAAAALLLVAFGLYKASLPSPDVARDGDVPKAEGVAGVVPLDPVTVDFLQQSELLLRNVMKIEPGDAEDLADAKQMASRQLPELDQRKQAAALAPPVVRVMDTYETILRDIRNIDRRTAGEDITDIQERIQRNGLIAGIKAFQPERTEARFVFR